MQASYKFCSELEDIAFKYERMTSLIEALQMLVTDGPAEIHGLPDNTVQYSLYEISLEMNNTNDRLKQMISEIGIRKSA